jgi:hypothetical protein
MGVLTTEVGYTSATTRRGGHEVHKGHVVALKKIYNTKYYYTIYQYFLYSFPVFYYVSLVF